MAPLQHQVMLIIGSSILLQVTVVMLALNRRLR
jgi:hypothetical protein